MKAYPRLDDVASFGKKGDPIRFKRAMLSTYYSTFDEAIRMQDV